MRNVATVVAEAKAQAEALSPDQVTEEAKTGALLVDLREPEERVAQGTVPGAVFAPRGMLEFWADPDSPYHRAEFDPSRRLILYCASGGRSALAATTLSEMGFDDVAHLDGGLKAWKEAGHPVELPN
jgi:rhodanese-related sulfurtransferase